MDKVDFTPLIGSIVSSAKPGTWMATGWFNERTGEVFVVPSMKHDLILDRYEGAASEIREIRDRESDDTQDFIDCHEEDGHVGWHAWDDESYRELERRVYDRVYADGWIRWGFYHYPEYVATSRRPGAPFSQKLDVTAPYPRWNIKRADGTVEELTKKTKSRRGDDSIDATPARYKELAETLSSELHFQDSRW